MEPNSYPINDTRYRHEKTHTKSAYIPTIR